MANFCARPAKNNSTFKGQDYARGALFEGQLTRMMFDIQGNAILPTAPFERTPLERTPLERTPVEYPHTWFIEHPDALPRITPRYIPGSTLAEARTAALETITSAEFNLTLINGYIQTACKSMAGQYPATKTFGRAIGGNITPLNLLDCPEIVAPVPEGAQPVAVPPLAILLPEDYFLICYFACLYRLSRTTVANRPLLIKRMNATLASMPGAPAHRINGAHIGGFLPLFESNHDLKCLLAAIDMFLACQPRHDGAKIRVGTVVCRYDACSGLTYIPHLMTVLGVEKITDILMWLWTPELISNVNQLYLYPYENAHSYFPYFFPMGLSNKSPYSVTSNQALHVFTHGLGSLVGNTRSKNAVMQHDLNVANIAKNIAGAFIGAGQNGETVFEKLEDRRFQFTPQEFYQLKQAAQAITRPRDGSVGEWMSRTFLTLLDVFAEDE